MTTEEKETLYAIKKILRFKNYRTMILSLCGFTSYQINVPDISLQYSELQDSGLAMNKIAKDLNSGCGINNETFSLFIRKFTQLLINISEELSGGKEVVA